MHFIQSVLLDINFIKKKALLKKVLLDIILLDKHLLDNHLQKKIYFLYQSSLNNKLLILLLYLSIVYYC